MIANIWIFAEKSLKFAEVRICQTQIFPYLVKFLCDDKLSCHNTIYTLFSRVSSPFGKCCVFTYINTLFSAFVSGKMRKLFNYKKTSRHLRRDVFHFCNGDSRSEAGTTCKGIKREATCGLAFDTRSDQTSKRNDKIHYPIKANAGRTLITRSVMAATATAKRSR